MNRDKIQIAIYMAIYLILLISSFISMFLPWYYDSITDLLLLQVESIGFYAFIGIFIMIASFVIYCLYIWSEINILKNVGFYLGLGGSIEASVFGIFGFYYFYKAIRFDSLILPGAISSGVIYLASIVFISLIYIKLDYFENLIDDEIVYVE
ncbi:MAG: hypothetical protein GF329_16425 [Candidatus Lokiarchaeota archaeon]|nr:hypothetical protein [Candidatus Lokiarchaeota archaeon]